LVPEVLQVSSNPEPTIAGVRGARALVLHGYDLRREVGGPIATAQRRLSSAVVMSGSRTTSPARGSRVDLLDAWARSAGPGVERTALMALGDARVALDRLAGRDLIHPDHIDDSPLETD
jgi:hypothetical protein